MSQISKFPAEGSVVPRAGLMQDAADWQGEMAASKLRLFKDETITLGSQTTLAELVAAEASYDGYVAGGIAIAAFLDPLYESGVGAVVHSPLVQFNYVDAGGDPDTIGGWFLVDAAGKLRGCGALKEPATMGTNDDAVAVVVARVFKG